MMPPKGELIQGVYDGYWVGESLHANARMRLSAQKGRDDWSLNFMKKVKYAPDLSSHQS
jgi:hypothetical protein